MDVWLLEWGGDGDHDMAYEEEEEVMEEDDDDDVCDLWQLNMKWMKQNAWNGEWKVVVDLFPCTCTVQQRT